MQKVEQIISYIKENKIYEAQKLVVKNFKDKPGMFYYYLGLINLKKEDYLSAIVCLKTARKNNINSYLISYNLSICYMHLKQNDFAKSELIEAIKLNPEYLNSYSNLCNIFLEENNIQNAYRTIKYAKACNKEDKDKLKKLINIESKLNLNKYI